MKGAGQLAIRDAPGGAILTVKAVPGASRSRVAGVLGDALKVCVAAAPEKGRANAVIAQVLADALGLPAKAIVLIGGATNPRKEFHVSGLSARQLRQRLEQL